MASNVLSCRHCTGKNLHLLGVLIDQGGAVTKIDGSGTRLLRGYALTYVRRSLPCGDHGTTVHTLYGCGTCDPTSITVQSDTFRENEVVRQWTALVDCELTIKELWRE